VKALREVLEPAIRSPGALQHQVRAREEMNIRSVIDGMRTQGSQDFSRHSGAARIGCGRNLESVSHLPVHETDSSARDEAAGRPGMTTNFQSSTRGSPRHAASRVAGTTRMEIGRKSPTATANPLQRCVDGSIFQSKW
jgi:hypothetical protein